MTEDAQDTGARQLLFQQPVMVAMHDATDPVVWEHLLSHAEDTVRRGLVRELMGVARDIRWRQLLVGLSWRAMTPGPDPDNPAWGGTEVPWEPGQPLPDGALVLMCRARASLRPEIPEPAPVSYPAPIFTKEGQTDD